MKLARDPSAKSELLEALRKKVGQRFTLIDAHSWLPHYTQGNIAGVIWVLHHEFGALKLAGKVPHPKPSKHKRRSIAQYEVTPKIHHDIPTKCSIKYEGHKTRSPSEKNGNGHAPSRDRVDRAHTALLAARAALEVLGVVAIEPTDLDQIPEQKLAQSLRRRGWMCMEPRGYHAREAEKARPGVLANFLMKQIHQ